LIPQLSIAENIFIAGPAAAMRVIDPRRRLTAVAAEGELRKSGSMRRRTRWSPNSGSASSNVEIAKALSKQVRL